MPKFIFRYETLLRHRRNLEDQAQRRLAERVRKRMILTDQLRGMQTQITTSKRDLGDALVGKIDLSRVGEFTRYTAESTLRGRELVKRLAEIEPQVDAARQALLSAIQQRKALDVLRERDFAAWKREQDRKETAELDELASQAYTRRLFEEQRAVPETSGSSFPAAVPSEGRVA